MVKASLRGKTRPPLPKGATSSSSRILASRATFNTLTELLDKVKAARAAGDVELLVKLSRQVLNVSDTLLKQEAPIVQADRIHVAAALACFELGFHISLEGVDSLDGEPSSLAGWLEAAIQHFLDAGQLKDGSELLKMGIALSSLAEYRVPRDTVDDTSTPLSFEEEVAKPFNLKTASAFHLLCQAASKVEAATKAFQAALLVNLGGQMGTSQAMPSASNLSSAAARVLEELETGQSIVLIHKVSYLVDI